MYSVYYFSNSVYNIDSDETTRRRALDKACAVHGGECVYKILNNKIRSDSKNVIDDSIYVARNYLVFSLRRFGYSLTKSDTERQESLYAAIQLYGVDLVLKRLHYIKITNPEYSRDIDNDIAYIYKENCDIVARKNLSMFKMFINSYYFMRDFFNKNK